jgi:hypothetical protein
MCEILFDAIIVSYVGVVLIMAKDENNCGQFKTWMKGLLGIYIIDLILCMNHLMAVKKLKKDDVKVMIMSYVLLIFNALWFVWGNVIWL